MSVVSAGWSGGASSNADAGGGADGALEDVLGVGNGRGTAPDEAHAAARRLAASVTQASVPPGVAIGTHKISER